MVTINELLNEQEPYENDEESEYTVITTYEQIAYSDSKTVQITNKSIGSLNTQISVNGEINSQYIEFEHERYMDGVDLTKMLIQIHYEYGDSQKGNSDVVNVKYSDSSIIFGWLIPRTITENADSVMFMPFFFGTSPEGETYLLKDRYATYTINDGLSIEIGEDEPTDESWYQQFLKDIQDVRKFIPDAIEAEAAREEAETIRVAAENERISAEEERKEAEELRIDAENARIEAEEARQIAEEERISAETAREEASATAVANAEAATEALLEQVRYVTFSIDALDNGLNVTVFTDAE